MTEQVKVVTEAFTKKRLKHGRPFNPVGCEAGRVAWVREDGRWIQCITTGDARGAIPVETYRAERNAKSHRKLKQGYDARSAYAPLPV